MYYALVSISVVMFGLQFYCNQLYERDMGNGTAPTSFLIFGSNLLGVAVLLMANGFRLACTSFTLLMALVTAANMFLFSFCGQKALSRINLALYSLFSMLGGMVLPFATGIVFYGERFSVWKALCLIFVVCALLMTLQPKNKATSEKRGGTIFYIGIFVFNGMSGVLSKIYQAATYAKADEMSYSVWTGLLAAAMAGAVLLCVKDKKINQTFRSFYGMAGVGILNKVANLLLLFSLAYLPASVQYPMVTGGVIIISTLLSYFTPQKPKWRDWVACGFAFAAIIFVAL